MPVIKQPTDTRRQTSDPSRYGKPAIDRGVSALKANQKETERPVERKNDSTVD